MSQAIDMNAIRAEKNEAFVDLGFKFTTARGEQFYQLCVQYAKHEGRHVLDRVDRNDLRLSAADVLDYCVVTFIQRFGEYFWPADPQKRGHLQGTKDLLGTWQGGLNVEVHQNCQTPGNNDRSYWLDKLRSPLGCKVKRYFELMARVPTAMMPDLGPPTEEGMTQLMWIVLDTSKD